jgi:putative flavoprotein involved in K+ transport
MLEQVQVAIIGGGQAGLAAGYYLSRFGVNFVILERSQELGYSWRTRYDSLRLFTSARYSSLPGLKLEASDNYYPHKDEIADYLKNYAVTFNLPILLDSAVTLIEAASNNENSASSKAGYLIHSGSKTIFAEMVIIATGPFQKPYLPPLAAKLDSQIVQLHSSQYQNPQQLQSGPVLVVGAGNSGAQITQELCQEIDERPVYLSVGKRKPYLPQRLLGRDLFWWLEKLGIQKITIDSLLGKYLSTKDPLIGTNIKQLVRKYGLELRGRATELESPSTFHFARGSNVTPANVIWATGFKADYQSWIKVPIFDEAGNPVHRRGVTSASGLYFLGLAWQYRRGSALLGWVGQDAAYLAEHCARTLQSGAANMPTTKQIQKANK